MKTIFIDAKSPVDLTLPEDALSQLPKKIGIVTTVQHLHKIQQVRDQLPNAIMAGQVLGCRADAAKTLADKLDAFLYVGTGEFHPIQVALSSANKPIYCWNPVQKIFTQLDQEQIAAYQKRVQQRLALFFDAKNVGVLVSIKPGQNNNMITSPTVENKMNPIQEIMSRTDGKNYYLFAFDTLGEFDIENFPFINVWVNTACSRIFDDQIKKLVNWQDIKAYEETQ